jgi:hypothetical protein
VPPRAEPSEFRRASVEKQIHQGDNETSTKPRTFLRGHCSSFGLIDTFDTFLGSWKVQDEKNSWEFALEFKLEAAALLGNGGKH